MRNSSAGQRRQSPSRTPPNPSHALQQDPRSALDNASFSHGDQDSMDVDWETPRMNPRGSLALEAELQDLTFAETGGLIDDQNDVYTHARHREVFVEEVGDPYQDEIEDQDFLDLIYTNHLSRIQPGSSSRPDIVQYVKELTCTDIFDMAYGGARAPTLDEPWLETMLVRVISRYHMWKQRGGSAEAFGDGGGVTSYNRDGKNKRKRGWRNKRDENQGDENDDSDNEANDRSRRPAGPAASTKQYKAEFLACHFYRLSPIRHQRCYKMELRRIKDVKLHLKRCHAQPLYCVCCGMTFADDQDRLDKHYEERQCTRTQIQKPEGVTPNQFKMLARPVTRSDGLSKQWYSMWDILFPGQARPKSPFLNGPISEACREMDRFWEQEGLSIAVEVLGSGRFCGIVPALEDALEIGRLMLAKTVERLEKSTDYVHEPPQGTSTPDFDANTGGTSMTCTGKGTDLSAVPNEDLNHASSSSLHAGLSTTSLDARQATSSSTECHLHHFIPTLASNKANSSSSGSLSSTTTSLLDEHIGFHQDNLGDFNPGALSKYQRAFLQASNTTTLHSAIEPKSNLLLDTLPLLNSVDQSDDLIYENSYTWATSSVPVPGLSGNGLGTDSKADHSKKKGKQVLERTLGVPVEFSSDDPHSLFDIDWATGVEDL